MQRETSAATRARVMLACVACGACGAAVREPEPFAGVPREAYETVPYPPPHVSAELVPKSPDRRAVWVDGTFVFRPTGYVWVRGGWVIPPENARYFHSRFSYERDGTMRFATGAWYDERGRRLKDPPVLAPATAPPNERVEQGQ